MGEKAQSIYTNNNNTAKITGLRCAIVFIRPHEEKCFTDFFKFVQFDNFLLRLSERHKEMIQQNAFLL